MAPRRLGLSWLLIASVILLPGTFLITYITAWQLGHVHPILPYISYTGTEPPESCIFSQLLNIAAVVVSCAMYARYRQVREYLPTSMRHSIRLNKASLGLGLMSTLGVSIVGNFQVDTMFFVHFVGATLAFGVGTVYGWTQVILSFTTCPELSSYVICCLRVVFCITATVTFFLTFSFAYIAYYVDQSIRWKRLSTANEWVMSMTLVCYILTFFGEFQQISVMPKILHVKRRHTESVATQLSAEPILASTPSSPVENI